MDLLQQLQIDNTKTNAQLIVDAIVAGEANLQDLWAIFLDDDKRIRQRAGWPLTILSEQHSEILLPLVPDMIAALETEEDSITRNVVRAWQALEFHEDDEGSVYDICFAFLGSPQVAIAIRVFAMTVCTNIALRYPSLASELITLIEEHYEHGSAGYKSRAKRELLKLRKVI